MGNQTNAVVNLTREVLHPHGFLFRHETALQTHVVGGDPSRAGVFVAFECLDAPEGEHKTTSGSDEVSTDAVSPGDLCWRNQFSRCYHFDAVMQAIGLQCINCRSSDLI